MIGLPTGEPSGVLMLDIDRKEGVDGLANLKVLGIEPRDLSDIISLSPSGRKHVFMGREQKDIYCAMDECDLHATIVPRRAIEREKDPRPVSKCWTCDGFWGDDSLVSLVVRVAAGLHRTRYFAVPFVSNPAMLTPHPRSPVCGRDSWVACLQLIAAS